MKLVVKILILQTKYVCNVHKDILSIKMVFVLLWMTIVVSSIGIKLVFNVIEVINCHLEDALLLQLLMVLEDQMDKY